MHSSLPAPVNISCKLSNEWRMLSVIWKIGAVLTWTLPLLTGGVYFEASARENHEGVHNAFLHLCQEVGLCFRCLFIFSSFIIFQFTVGKDRFSSMLRCRIQANRHFVPMKAYITGHYAFWIYQTWGIFTSCGNSNCTAFLTHAQSHQQIQKYPMFIFFTQQGV